MHDPATCRDGDHYGQCSGVTLPLLRRQSGLPAICIRPGCGRNFTEHIHTNHLMEWCPRCTNLDGTMTDNCYCREEYAAFGTERKD